MTHIDAGSQPNNTHIHRPIFYLAMLLVLFSSLFRGSNRHIVLIGVEWISLLALMSICFGLLSKKNMLRLPVFGWRGVATGFIASAPIWIPVFQLWLLPAPAQTEILSSALAGLPLAAMLLLALSVEADSLKALQRAWIAVATLQAIIGIAQLSGWEALYFGTEVVSASIGTFANRNHFANFIAMTIPLVIFELKAPTRKPTQKRKPWLLLSVLFLLVAALLASVSRTGLITGMLSGCAAALVVFSSGKHSSKTSRLAVWLVPALALLALVAGGMDWLYRFEWDALVGSAVERAENRDAAWRGALAFLPFGSGLGTFEKAFAPWQPEGYAYWLDYAHSDLLQLFFETGVFAGCFLVAVLALVVQRAGRLTRLSASSGEDLTNDSRLSLVALCGLGALMLHAWVDFPTHIPANAMLGAFLLGTFLRESTESSSPSLQKVK